MTKQETDLRAAAIAALAYLEDDCEAHWSPEQRNVVENLRAALWPDGGCSPETLASLTA